MTATEVQIKQLRARAVNDVTREIMAHGIKLTWDQADDLGEITLNWMRDRLRLSSKTTDAGMTFRPNR